MTQTNQMDAFRSMPVGRAVLKNAVPAMAAMLMVLVYNLADTFFIGQTHDDILVAAVSLATPVFLIFMAVGTVFGIGGTSVISRALGEGRRDYARQVCSFCMWSCVGVGIVLSVLFLLFMDPILALVGASADTWEPTKTYLTIVALCGPFVLIANCYNNVIRAEGESTKAMMGQVIGNLTNVVLDPIMILTFDWGIAGAAIAQCALRRVLCVLQRPPGHGRGHRGPGGQPQPPGHHLYPGPVPSGGCYGGRRPGLGPAGGRCAVHPAGGRPVYPLRPPAGGGDGADYEAAGGDRVNLSAGPAG